MTTKITDYVRVAERALELGRHTLSGIAILPENLKL